MKSSRDIPPRVGMRRKEWREPGNSTGRRRVPFAAMIHFGPSCWEWLGGKYLCGYGQYNDRSIGKMVEAHRYSFAMINCPIPAGLHVLHKCDNRACVRHDHLFLGTPLDNARDMVAKGRHASQKKTHCPSGHEYTYENTYRHRNERQCRICKRRIGTESKRRTRRAENGN